MSRKRKNNVLDKLHIPRFTHEWVSPSKTRNAMINDYILDWLDIHGEAKGYIPDTKSDIYDPELDFSKYIMDQGKKFEEYIVKELREKFGKDFVEVTETDNYKKTDTTISLMKNGTPIIYQGMVFNPTLKIYGTPDLIVRSDYLNNMVTTPVVSRYQYGCNFNDYWHYRIIDIKFHTLHLKSNFTTICNDDSVRAFKAQCYLYNRCLHYMQGFHSRKSYILGRGWSATKKSVEYVNNNPFNKLGVIDYSNEDFNICEDALLAAKWYLRVKTDGKNWEMLPTPSIPELYPNMNIMSYKWKTVKNKIAKELEELTLIYSCGYYNRVYAHIQKLYKISDPKLTARSLDIVGKKNSDLVDGILEAYQEKQKISVDMSNHIKGFFVDIESISSIHNILDNSDTRVYMIGVGFFDSENNWNYKNFLAKQLDEKSETDMFIQFKDYIDSFNISVIWHYNSTDKNELDKLAGRVDDKFMEKYEFKDIYNDLKEGKIFIPGCLNFSLKNISKALGCSRYDESTIQSGSDSIIYGIRYYEKYRSSSSMDYVSYINNVIKYNEFDCLALSDVVRYISSSR